MSSYYNFGGPMGTQTRFNQQSAQSKGSPIRAAAGGRPASGYAPTNYAAQMRPGSNPSYSGVGTTS